MKNRQALAGIALGLVLGVASTALADLWSKAEMNHVRHVRKDRTNRLNLNRGLFQKTRNPGLKAVYGRKVANWERSLKITDRYEAAVKAGQRVEAKKLREAEHLLRLQAELLTQAVELRTSVIGYSLARKQVKAAVVPTLLQTAKDVEAAARAYDAGIATLSQ